MPKVRPLTKEQAARWKRDELCNSILEKVRERKGLYDLTDREVADRLKIASSTYSRAKRDGLLNLKFEVIFRMVDFVGYELKLEKIEDKKPQKKTISAKKDDTYGTIIEGLIRQIVQETINKSE